MKANSRIIQGQRQLQISQRPRKPPPDGKLTPPKMESPANSSRLPPLKSFGVLKERLGEGTFGSVTLWENAQTGQRVAIKEFRETDNGIIPYDAIREIAIIKALNHPNIISILNVVDFTVAPTSVGGVMAAIPLGMSDLKPYALRTSNFQPGIYKNIIYDLCKALHYLHERGVIHRDLKPANIIVIEGQKALIADFGCARFGAIPGEAYTANVQTAWWRAPEILLSDGKGISNYTSKIDVFSMGVIFMELLCGVYPLFGYDSVSQIARAQMMILGHFTPEHWPDVVHLSGMTPALKNFAASYVNGSLQEKVFDLLKPIGGVPDEVLKAKYKGMFTKELANPQPLGPGIMMVLRSMTIPDPSKRWSMEMVLQHNWFQSIRGEDSFPKNECGSMYRTLAVRPVLSIITDDSNVRRVLYGAGWELCDRFKLSDYVKFHYRFIFDEFFHQYQLLSLNSDPLIAEIGVFNKQDLVAILGAAVLISTQMFEPQGVTTTSLHEYFRYRDMHISELRLAHFQRAILKTLQLDVGINTAVEYLNGLLKMEDIGSRALRATISILSLFYVMEVETTISSERLVRSAIALATRAYAIPDPVCLRDRSFSEDEIDQLKTKLFYYHGLLYQKPYDTTDSFIRLRKGMERKSAKFVLDNIDNPRSWIENAERPAAAFEIARDPPSALQSPRKEGGTGKTMEFRCRLILKSITDNGIVYRVDNNERPDLVDVVTRQELSNVAKYMLQALAGDVINDLLDRGTIKKEPFLMNIVEYFKLHADAKGVAMKTTGVLSSNINISFGMPDVSTDLKVIFQEIPPLEVVDKVLQAMIVRINGDNVRARMFERFGAVLQAQIPK